MPFRLLAAVLVLLVVKPASAEVTSPLGLELASFTDSFYLGYPGPKDNVCGLRLNLFRSHNKDVCGLDLGLFWNGTEGSFTGLEIGGIMNQVQGHATIVGLQLAGMVNYDRQATIIGLQFALFSNKIDDEGKIVGGQFAFLANQAPKTDVYGFQFGVLNIARQVIGFQLGLFNIANDLRGIQIGLINVNRRAVPFHVFPIMNVGF